MKLLETYNGIKIYQDESKKPFVTVQGNVPVIGSLQTGHESIEAARLFVDKHINRS